MCVPMYYTCKRTHICPCVCAYAFVCFCSVPSFALQTYGQLDVAIKYECETQVFEGKFVNLNAILTTIYFNKNKQKISILQRYGIKGNKN